MSSVKQIDLNTSVLANNQKWAEQCKELFETNNIFVVNLMSSPGSGKTTLLEKSFAYLTPELNVGVIVGDIATTEDAERLRTDGVPVVQINTHGACHLDAQMVHGVLESFDLSRLDLLIVENVGNLVCPADFSFGEDMRVAALSTTEGNDKVSKYPEMFRKSDAVIVNKMDLLPYVDFDMDRLTRDLKSLGVDPEVFSMTARNGEVVDAWCKWLIGRVKK